MVRTAFLILAVTLSLHAHKINLFAELIDGKLSVEAYFAGGGSCKSCTLEVRDSHGEVIHQEKMSAQGRSEMTLAQLPPYTVVVDAGLGHKAEVRVLSGTHVSGESDAHAPHPAEPMRQEPESLPVGKIALGLLLIAGAVVLIRQVKKPA